MTGLHFLGCGESVVGLARGEQSGEHVTVDFGALRLPVRPVRPTHLGPLIPIQAKPAQRVQQRQIAFLAVALGVGVLDAEHEGATGVPGVGPVEQRGADQTDVRSSGG